MRISDWSSDVCSSDLLYLVQQLLNALTLGCVYALLANGYALVHRIVGRFNLAFGDMAMVGAVVTVIATVAVGAAGLTAAPGLAAALATAVRSEGRRVGKAGVRTFCCTW